MRKLGKIALGVVAGLTIVVGAGILVSYLEQKKSWLDYDLDDDFEDDYEEEFDDGFDDESNNGIAEDEPASVSKKEFVGDDYEPSM